MTLAVWPVELPPPVEDSFEVRRDDGRVRNARDAGPRNVRRRFSALSKSVSITFQLTRSQLAVFENFYEDDLRQGTRPFLMPAPGTDGYALLTDDGVPLLTDEDVPLLVAETWLCLFGDRLPSTQVRGVTWTVSFDLEVLPS